MSEPVDLRDFSQSLPMALMRARERVMREFRPLLGEHDLSEQQWRTLRALAASDDRLEVADLASRTFLLGPSMSRILSNLEGRGLVDRAAGADQRRALIGLTVRGHELVAKVAPQSEFRYAQITEGFGAERLAQLYTLLADLAELDDGAGHDRDGAELDAGHGPPP